MIYPALPQGAVVVKIGGTAASQLIGSALASVAEPQLFQAVFVGVASMMSARLLLGGTSWRLGEIEPSHNLSSGGDFGLSRSPQLALNRQLCLSG